MKTTETMTKHERMIYDAIEWAYDVNGTQGALDIASAMGIEDERKCEQCYEESEMTTPHFDDCCVVCGTYDKKKYEN